MSGVHISDRTRTPRDAALAFFVKSQHRVIAHCERLLAAEDLAPDQRARLLALRDQVNRELDRLTAAQAA